MALLMSSLSEVDGRLDGDAVHVRGENATARMCENSLCFEAESGQLQQLLSARSWGCASPLRVLAQAMQTTSRYCSTSLMESTVRHCAPQRPCSSCSQKSSMAACMGSRGAALSSRSPSSTLQPPQRESPPQQRACWWLSPRCTSSCRPTSPGEPRRPDPQTHSCFCHPPCSHTVAGGHTPLQIRCANLASDMCGPCRPIHESVPGGIMDLASGSADAPAQARPQDLPPGTDTVSPGASIPSQMAINFVSCCCPM